VPVLSECHGFPATVRRADAPSRLERRLHCAGVGLTSRREGKPRMSLGVDWYPVALSGGVEVGTATGTRLLGREIALWRDAAGVAHAWKDRCPHRGMRLSFGFVRGDRLGCLYHGWEYDGAGRCRRIPAHPDLAVPDTIRATTFPCQERLGMIWVHAGPGAAPPNPPAERGPVTPVRSLHVDCPPETVLDRLAAERDRAVIAVPLDDMPLLAAVQPVAERVTTLHLVIAGDPAAWRGAGQKRAALWAEDLRRDLEARAAP
jgi:nitrite reductase/ring-hydroxylating ferredoxin subunit